MLLFRSWHVVCSVTAPSVLKQNGDVWINGICHFSIGKFSAESRVRYSGMYLQRGHTLWNQFAIVRQISFKPSCVHRSRQSNFSLFWTKFRQVRKFLGQLKLKSNLPKMLVLVESCLGAFLLKNIRAHSSWAKPNLRGPQDIDRDKDSLLC